MNADGKKFNQVQLPAESLELSSSDLNNQEIIINSEEFRMEGGGNSSNNIENLQNFEEYVKRPFEGKVTLDEPVSVTIVKNNSLLQEFNFFEILTKI